MINSRAKGKCGELEFSHFLQSMGVKARRGAQFSGGPESPDVVTELPVHIEVKRVEALQLRAAIQQAKDDSGGKPWCVAHRWNRGDWVAIVDMRWLIQILAGKGDPEPP